MQNPSALILGSFAEKLADDEQRYYFQMTLLSAALGATAVFMTVLNVFTQQWLLMVMTSFFAVCSLVNVAMLIGKKTCTAKNYVLFDFAVFTLFSYFLMTGGTDGFSPLWILLLPACGMIFFGKLRGGVLGGIMGLIVIFFLWTPWGEAVQLYCHFDCNDTFRTRFPIVYIAFFAIGYLFEIIRYAAYKEMVRAQRKLKLISETDQLTQTYNRQWFNERVQQELDGTVLGEDCICLLADIDNFKIVNDTYGHLAGDNVLRSIAAAIRLSLSEEDCLCRWGGEEFFVYIPKCPGDLRAYCEHILDSIREFEMHDEAGRTFHVTVSLGAVLTSHGEVFSADRVFSEVDKCLYEAKSTGKNKVVIHY